MTATECEKVAHIEQLVVEIDAIFTKNKLEPDIACGTLIELAARIFVRASKGDSDTCAGLVAAGQELLAKAAAIHLIAARWRS